MISYQQILDKVKRKENLYIKSIITGENIFPCNIPCNKKESDNFLENVESYESLMKKSKNSVGFGYKIITNKDENPNSKVSTKIKKIIIEDERDFQYLDNCQKEGIEFKKTIFKFRELFQEEIINEYLINNKKSLFNSTSEYIDNFIEIAKFLIDNPSSLLYPREIATTVNTKFLENNITSFISFVKYFREIDTSLEKWQQLGLLNPSSTVALRYNENFVIKSHNSCFKTSIISVEPTVLKNMSGSFSKIFIIENKTTFFTFPLQENECAIYCGGFAVLMLKNIDFLRKSKLYYFGDLDEHGFAILSKFRELYNNTISICMDKETIDDHRKFLIKGEIYKGSSTRLTPSEKEALFFLENNKISNCSSRIEQEKIANSYILEKMKKIDTLSSKGLQ